MKLVIGALLLALILIGLSECNLHAETGVFRDGYWYWDSKGDGVWHPDNEYFQFGMKGDVPVWRPDTIPPVGLSGNNPLMYCVAGANPILPAISLTDDFGVSYSSVVNYLEDSRGCVRFCIGAIYHRTCCPIVK